MDQDRHNPDPADTHPDAEPRPEAPCRRCPDADLERRALTGEATNDELVRLGDQIERADDARRAELRDLKAAAADTLPDVRSYLRDRAAGLDHPDSMLAALAPGLVEARQEPGHDTGVRRARVAHLLDAALEAAEYALDDAHATNVQTGPIADLAEAHRALAPDDALGPIHYGTNTLDARPAPTLAELLTDELIDRVAGHVYAELDRSGHTLDAAVKAQTATVGGLRILRDEALSNPNPEDRPHG